MKKKLSIHDIARELKVSATTVSFVLNGKADAKKIGKNVQERILHYINETGYKPSILAQGLRTGKSKIIGMLVEDISDPFFSAISRVVEQIAYKSDYKIFYSSTENDTDKAITLIRAFREYQVDGYIIVPAPGLHKEIKRLMDDNLPVVLFDRYFADLATSNVVVDNKKGAYTATAHLCEEGYTHIGLVTLESSQIQMEERLQGYLQALGEWNIPSYILKIPYSCSEEKRIHSIRAFYEQHPELKGLVFATNYLAVAGIEALIKIGLTIPTDIGIVGFDDNTHFTHFSPSVTAISQPIELLSKTVIEVLLKHLRGNMPTPKTETTSLPTTLIVRQSSVRHSVGPAPGDPRKWVANNIH